MAAPPSSTPAEITRSWSESDSEVAGWSCAGQSVIERGGELVRHDESRRRASPGVGAAGFNLD